MFHGFRPMRPLPDEEVESLGEEQRYWNRLEEAAVFQESGHITNVDFMPADPYFLASACHQRLLIYDTLISEPIAQFSRFKSSVSSINYRPDGGLLGAGTVDGEIQFFNVQKHQFKKEGRALKKPVRSYYKAHKAKVNVVAYEAPAFVRFVSMADDGLAKLWDLADTRADNSEALWRGVCHPGFKLTTGLLSRSNSHLLITGSDDQTIRMWDTRSKGGKASAHLMEMQHGDAVSKILLFPNDSICVSAGASTIKLWDITAGGKLLYTLENHTKDITSLSFATDNKCLLSAGMDCRIHAFGIDNGEFPLIKTWKTAAPVLSISMSADDQTMAFGMTNVLTVYRRKQETEFETNGNTMQTKGGVGSAHDAEETNDDNEGDEFLWNGKRRRAMKVYIDVNEPKDKQQRRIGLETVKQHVRGCTDQPIIVKLSERPLDKMCLGTLDYLLKQSRYREIITTIVKKQLLASNPSMVVAALHQIRFRQKLTIALSGHSSEDLSPFIQFLHSNLFRTSYFDILCDVVDVFFTIYAEETLSLDVRKAINNLRNAIQSEIQLLRQIARTRGVMDMLLKKNVARNGRQNTILCQKENPFIN